MVGWIKRGVVRGMFITIDRCLQGLQRSLIKDIVQAHVRISVHKLCLQARCKCLLRLLALVKRRPCAFKPALLSCNEPVWRAVRLCIEVTHQDHFISRSHLAIDPEQHMLGLQASHIVVSLVDRMVQVRVDKYEVTLLGVLNFNHLTVAHCTQMQYLIRDNHLVCEPCPASDHSITILIEVGIWAFPNTGVLDLTRSFMHSVVLLGREISQI